MAQVEHEESFSKLDRLPHGVYVLTFHGNGEHRLNPRTVAAIHSALDKVEEDPNAAALVTTNEGKFYSNGMDRENFSMEALGAPLHGLIRRLLCFPMPTVAAVCGHAAAGGCLLVYAHDFRLMRRDRGFIFLNEMEMGIPLTRGLTSLLRCKLPPNTFHESVLSARRYTGKSAEQAGIVDASLPDVTSTRTEAIRRATELAKKRYNRSIYKAIKCEMFRTELHELSSREITPEGSKLLAKL